MWCAIYLLCLLFAGWGIVVRLGWGRSRLESLGLIACMGPGIVGMGLIVLSMLGVTPSRAEIFILSGIIGLSGFLPWRSAPPPMRGPSEDQDRTPKWWLGLCLLAIGYSAYVVALDAFVYPTVEWDAFAIWQLKSKILTDQPLVPRPQYFTDVSRGYSHLGYPILVPMISAGEHAMAGSLDDEKEKAPLYLLYLGMGAVVYGAIRRPRGGFAAITTTALVMAVPKMLVVAGNGTADVPLTAFYACSLVCLLNWQQDRRTADLILTAIFTIFIAWTKQEGLEVALINVAAVFALAPRRPLAWAGFAAAVGLAYLPWYLYSHDLPRTDENYFGHLQISVLIGNLSRLPTVILGFLGSAFDWDTWCVFWFALGAAALLEIRRIREPAVALLWILLIAHFLAYLPPYIVVMNWNYRELMAVTQDRLLLHIAPAAALLIGLQFPRLKRLEPNGGRVYPPYAQAM
jgi:hypothetical protein